MAQAPATLACTAHRASLTALSSTTSSSWRATLASIPAAPILLWRTPSRHPIGKASVAIVGSGSSCDAWSATGALPWAALSMHPAAPLFLTNGPSHHPIGESVGTIVWIGRCDWHRWKRRRHWHWWRDRLRASDMVDPAAPRPLVCLPHVRCVHRTIEGVDWTDRPRRRERAWRRSWRRRWGSGWWGWRRSRWRSGHWSGWCLGGSGATNPPCAAAILLLRWRPHRCCRRVHHAS